MRQVLGGFLIATALALYALALANTAWVCDDAYISFRCVDNLLHGYGLTWNVDERVQVFTNPLWVLLNAVAASFNGEPWHIFFSALALATSVSLAAVLVLALGVARGTGAAVFALVSLAFSRSFVDYSTSGLENPLTHLLLALFMLPFLRVRWTPRVIFFMSLCAGLAMTNRMDTILLFAPVLVYAWLAERNFRSTLALAAGFLPFVAWEIFAVLYYGFPFPNTAYAKLGTGIAAWDFVGRGLLYVSWNPFHRDPTTLFLLVSGLVVAPFLLKGGRYRALALGAWFYLVYVVTIGGDFMEGRFLAAPVFLAMILLVRLRGQHWMAWATLSAVSIMLCISGARIPITDSGYDSQKSDWGRASTRDQRQFYTQQAGLRFWDRKNSYPDYDWAQVGKRLAAANRYETKLHGAVGFVGFFAGPKIHILDYHAVADPLLARIPALYEPSWFIGHFERCMPRWYLDMFTAMSHDLEKTGPGKALACDEQMRRGLGPKLPGGNSDTSKAARTNVDLDPDLMAYYQHLSIIVRGPIWEVERFRAILAMNLGRYDSLINDDLYRFPYISIHSLKEVSTQRASGARRTAKGVVVFPKSGIEIDLGGVRHQSQIEFSADYDEKYRLLFRKGTETVATLDVTSLDRPENGGLQVATVDVPNAAIRAGYDSIRFVAYAGDGKRYFGHLRLL